MGREAACLSSATLQVSYCASMVLGYATPYADYAIDTCTTNQCTQQMFYESVLQEPIQEYHLKAKREVVLKGTLHKEGVCVCVC